MRTDTTTPQKTNIASLAATVGVVAFVIWLVSFAAAGDSLFAQAQHAPTPASADLSSTHTGADTRRSADRGPTHAGG
jgi:hypothetical protein